MDSVQKVGFNCWNGFLEDIKHIKQLYDFTLHLYVEEHERLKERLKDPTSPESMHTKIGTVTHSVKALASRSAHTYPRHLRTYLLIAIVIRLEAFLTDLVKEISYRDLIPFKSNQTIEIPVGELLSYSSMTTIQERLISRTLRSLTSGGLKEIEKFYKSKFGLEFSSCGSNYSKVVEIHDRRHFYMSTQKAFVMRNMPINTLPWDFFREFELMSTMTI